jgi:hypothetical protein
MLLVLSMLYILTIMRGFLMICLLGFIAYSVYYVAIHDKKLLGPKIVEITNVVKKQIGVVVPQEQDIACALHSLTPELNSHTKNPVAISVLVDNTNKDCAKWTVFEGQAGVVELYDDHDVLLEQGVLTTNSDWTTGFPATYTASLGNFLYTGKVKLIIKEEDPSGQKEPKQSYTTFFID